MKVGWMTCGGGNFGDEFTEAYLGWMYPDIPVEHVLNKNAHLIAAGSLVHGIPFDYTGYIVGTGMLFGSPHPLRHAKVLSVRGPLTAKFMGLPVNYPQGDIGLLAADLPHERTDEFELGVMPHYIDRDLVHSHQGHYIDITLHPTRVVQEMARCSKIVSSSLHAIIAADSLGIAAAYVPHPQVAGDGFKFRDYYLSAGREFVPHVFGSPTADKVKEMQEHARTSLDTVVHACS